jgi:hypothetical protein
LIVTSVIFALIYFGENIELFGSDEGISISNIYTLNKLIVVELFVFAYP